MILGGLIIAEFRRVIEKFDFLIIAGITLCLMFFIPALQPGIPLGTAGAVAVLAGSTTNRYYSTFPTRLPATISIAGLNACNLSLRVIDSCPRKTKLRF